MSVARTVRIEGQVMEPEKHVRIALRSIFGIGETRAKEICGSVGLVGSERVKTISDDVWKKVQDFIHEQVARGEWHVESELRRKEQMQIKHLKDVGCYRGKRHRMKLPCRGQRTRTNARTRKGPRGKRGSSK